MIKMQARTVQVFTRVNIFKQFVGNSRRIVRVCLIVLWGCCLKGQKLCSTFCKVFNVHLTILWTLGITELIPWFQISPKLSVFSKLLTRKNEEILTFFLCFTS